MKSYAKQKFNPYDKEHLKMYRRFLQTRNWEFGCPFVVEWPYDSVPVMIEKKLIEAYLDDIISVLVQPAPSRKKVS